MLLSPLTLDGYKAAGIPGLTAPDFVLSTPASLPPPGNPMALMAAAPPGVPVISNETYTLDSGDRVRVIVFG